MKLALYQREISFLSFWDWLISLNLILVLPFPSSLSCFKRRRYPVLLEDGSWVQTVCLHIGLPEGKQ